MLGFVLGTGEGREILKKVNEFTEEIVVSTATAYGGTLYKENKIKHLNTKPLDEEGFKELISTWGITTFVDASHPYASEVSKTVINACESMGIKYIRYERESYFDLIEAGEKIIRINEYEELTKTLENIEGNVLNTTGSNHANLINSLQLKNRIIHRVLPSWTVIKKMVEGGINLGDIIAVKGPFKKPLNDGIIEEYNIKVMITKDSGLEGGVEEKVQSAFEHGVKIILINKPKVDYKIKFNSIDKLIEYIRKG